MTTKARSSDRSVVGKAAAILMTFRNGYRHTMTDIAESTGIPPSTVHRLIKDLTASQLLERTEEGDYRLGLPIRLSATFDRPSRNIDGIAQVLLQDLSDVTGCGAKLGVLSGPVVAFMEKQPGRRPAPLIFSEMCAPAHATAMGKVLLAFSSKQAVQSVLRQGLESYTPFTITAPDRLRRSLDMIRRTQLAVSRSELTMNQSAIAVPVFGSNGRIEAAIEMEVDDVASKRSIVTPALLVAGRSLGRELASLQSCGSRSRGSPSRLQ